MSLDANFICKYFILYTAMYLRTLFRNYVNLACGGIIVDVLITYELLKVKTQKSPVMFLNKTT